MREISKDGYIIKVTFLILKIYLSIFSPSFMLRTGYSISFQISFLLLPLRKTVLFSEAHLRFSSSLLLSCLCAEAGSSMYKALL